MLKFFNNRELADKLTINLARWKRWSREFLPPDPLAGQQAGYARQYYVDNAFTVFMGGHLVADLGFSIPEARKILAESREWMRSQGFQFDPRGKRKPRNGIDACIKSYALHIRATGNGQLTIYARGTLERREVRYEGFQVSQISYVDQPITPAGGRVPSAGDAAGEKVLLISVLLKKFCKALDPEGKFFPGLVETQDSVPQTADLRTRIQ